MQRFLIYKKQPNAQINLGEKYPTKHPIFCSVKGSEAKDIMNEDMEGANDQEDLAYRHPAFGILSENMRNVRQISSEACIFKVQEGLRQTKPKAYTPLTISIGPYHHGKPELRKMERLKVLYTRSFLNRAGLSLEECWRKLKDLEVRADRYYGDDKEQVRGDEFVNMLLLDGCFIVEFVVKSYLRLRQEDILGHNFMISGIIADDIVRDMLLMENQLPFFVLQLLYGDVITTIPGNPEFSWMVKIAFRDMLPRINTIFSRLSTEINTQEEIIKHLLQVVHILCKPPQRPTNNNGQILIQQPQGSSGNGSDRHRHRHYCTCTCASFVCNFGQQPAQQSVDHDFDCTIRTASELQEAGVDFQKVGKITDASSETPISLFDIKFNHGVLKIPTFALFDSTETFFRNLIAYEQHSDVSPMYFTDYAKFMDDLINTEKDVNLLRLKNVFINGLGDDKEVTNLFNNLCKEVTYYSGDFYYKDVCIELNRHCKKLWNVAMAKLRRDYFHSPWAVISTLAAILLLSLTIAQTVLGALSLQN